MKERLHESAYKETSACVQCGYCLPACPTYASIGKESASPRGRIHLVKLAAEGRIDVLRDLAEPIDLCLGCRACEPVCPMNVKYGTILEAAREAIALRREAEPRPADRLTRAMLRHVFPYPRRLRRLGSLARLAQRTGVRRAVRASGIIGAFSPKYALFEKALPPLPPVRERVRFGGTYPAVGMRKARVALFAGCIMDAVMYRAHHATVRLLTAVGVEVVVPDGQRCCGALHAHQGMADEAKELARRNIEAFERSGAEWVVNNAGGCGAALSEYGHLLRDEPEWAERARRFAARSKDVSEILLAHGPLPFADGGEELVATYQDSCHLRNVQRVSEAPRALLKQIPGVRLVELAGADQCCGSGGIYNLLQFEQSMDILDRKMEQVEATGACAVVTGNPGCMLQMQIGIEREGQSRRMRSVHLVELLAERCGL